MECNNFPPAEIQQAWINQMTALHNVIYEAHRCAANAETFSHMEQQERLVAKGNWRSNMIIKLLSPIFALIIAYYLWVLLSLLGAVLNTPWALYEGTAYLVIAIVVEVILLLIPLRYREINHLVKADQCMRAAQENVQRMRLVIKENENLVATIPEKYWYPLATGYLVELFQTGRATSLPVALDKLEEQIHRWNMEWAMQQTLSSQINQLQTLKNIQAATTVSAVAAVKYIVKG